MGPRTVAVLAGAGLPLGLGAGVFAGICAVSGGAPASTSWPPVLRTWMAAAAILGFIGAMVGAWTASKPERPEPVVQSVALLLGPAGFAALGGVAWGLVEGRPFAGLAHAAALFVPGPAAAALSAWLLVQRHP